MLKLRCVLLLLLLLVPATPSSARAGGGHSYSGGSSRGSSSSSRSSSSSSSSRSWSSSSSRSSYSSSSSGSGSSGGSGSGSAGFAGLLLLSFMVLLLWLLVVGSGNSESNDSLPSEAFWVAPPSGPADDLPAALDELRRKDPAFVPQAFTARVRQAFLDVQEAWNKGDLRSVRHYLSDGTHERFKTLLAMNESLGFANKTEGMQVRSATIQTVTCGAIYDNITVTVRATSRDYDVKKSGKILRDERSGFTEHWTFVRRASAKTLAAGAKGLMEGSCPSCGAAIALTDKTECTHCQSLVASGEHDWVLVEITQAGREARRLSEPLRQMTAKLRARDPLFSRQTLEDRVSTLFWRLRATELAESKAYGSVGVGDVFLSSADVSSETAAEHDDKLTFTVLWSAVPRGTHASMEMRTRMTMVRDPGAKTASILGFLSLRCAACGGTIAPRPGLVEACGRCGASLADKTKDWVLADVDDEGQRRQVAA